jgi:hypothetical protein
LYYIVFSLRCYTYLCFCCHLPLCFSCVRRVTSFFSDRISWCVRVLSYPVQKATLCVVMFVGLLLQRHCVSSMCSVVNCDFLLAPTSHPLMFCKCKQRIFYEQERAAGTAGAVSILRIHQSPQKERSVVMIPYVPSEALS